jgi:hypothetical protein
MLDDTQNGFRKGWSWTDCIFTINQITEKHMEFNLPILTAFLNYEKAFDKVIRTKICQVMIDKVLPQHLIKMAQSLYLDTRITTDNRKGE